MPYRPDRQLITIAEAHAILAVHGRPIERVERVPLETAEGRVLAATLVATFDVPPFRRAMMDGYAVRAADTAGASPDAPVRLPLRGFVYTGHAPEGPLAAGSCTGIATGAPVPDEADAVVMVEQTQREGDAILFHQAAQRGQNIGRAGSDLVAGETALVPGALLTPARVGAAAALGRTELDVYARPRVAILSTGDEIVAPGARLGPAQIYDSNTPALAAAIRAHGGEAVPVPRVPDDPPELRAAFEACLAEDLVLFSGGTSVGERDYLLDIISEAGRVHFEGLRLKPGRPTVFAEARGTPVFGMPGNPVSCLTNMYLLVAPLLRRIARLPPPLERRTTARLRDDVPSPGGRHQIYPVRLEKGEAIPVFKGSGEITSLAHADGYFEIGEEITNVEAGTVVEVTLF